MKERFTTRWPDASHRATHSWNRGWELKSPFWMVMYPDKNWGLHPLRGGGKWRWEQQSISAIISIWLMGLGYVLSIVRGQKGWALGPPISSILLFLFILSCPKRLLALSLSIAISQGLQTIRVFTHLHTYVEYLLCGGHCVRQGDQKDRCGPLLSLRCLQSSRRKQTHRPTALNCYRNTRHLDWVLWGIRKEVINSNYINRLGRHKEPLHKGGLH